MIPLKLELKNFLSYGPELQKIDFQPYSLICLSGKNGHGKSALLDAITWALWGHARKPSGMSKPDHALLHLGKTQMMVCFEFMFNNQHYKIRREYAFTYGKPYAALDFGIYNTEQNAFVSLTDKTIRKTQQKIENLLRLSFDAFINSCFLRQGQSNEFSQKGPRERKDVLASILGLQKFENIKKRALEASRAYSAQKNTLEQTIETLEKELVQSKDIQNQLDESAAQLNKLSQTELLLVQQKKELVEKQGSLQQKNEHYHTDKAVLQNMQEQQKAFVDTLYHKRNEWRSVHRTICSFKPIENLKKQIEQQAQNVADHQKHYEHMLNTRQELLQLNTTLQEHIRIRETKTQQEANTLAFEKEKTHLYQRSLTKDIAGKRQIAQDLEGAIASYTKTTHELENRLRTAQKNLLAPLEKQFEKRKEYYQTYVAQGAILVQQQQQLKEKTKQLSDPHNPSCPLCMQTLSASRKRFLHAQHKQNITRVSHRIQRLHTVTTNLKSRLVQQHTVIEEEKSKEKKNESIKTELKQIQEKITDLKQQQKLVVQELETLENEYKKTKGTITTLNKKMTVHKQQVQKTLSADTTYRELKKQIETLQRTLKHNSYTPDTHKEDKKRLQTLEHQLSISKKGEAFHSQRTQLQSTLADLCASLRNIKRQCQEQKNKLKQYDSLQQQIDHIKTQEITLEAKWDTYRTDREALVKRHSQLSTHAEHLKKYDGHKRDAEKKLTQTRYALEDYRVIAHAVGKEGIQALLIEQAIPEIEQEANLLLERLTDNQAHISIESLKDLKKGGTRETLDINISDSVGIRPYELFSGGEAFRIDFALRIAISRLLAHRAGTSLQTLIIDEGFGSQDEEGLTRILDAIYKIQDDFQKIIIVSHLPLIKEHFPVHFQVTKGPQGSALQVIEQA